MKYWKILMKKKRIFIFCIFTVKNIFHCSETYFRIFTGLLLDIFLLIFIYILWYENYHISLVAITTREIFIFTLVNENKSRIYGKKKLE